MCTERGGLELRWTPDSCTTCVCSSSLFNHCIVSCACILSLLVVFNITSFTNFHDSKSNYWLLSLLTCANCWTIIFVYSYLPPPSLLLASYFKRLPLYSTCCLDSSIKLVWFRDGGRVLPEELVQQLTMCVFPKLLDRIVVPSPWSVKMSMASAAKTLWDNTCSLCKLAKTQWGMMLVMKEE